MNEPKYWTNYTWRDGAAVAAGVPACRALREGWSLPAEIDKHKLPHSPFPIPQARRPVATPSPWRGSDVAAGVSASQV